VLFLLGFPDLHGDWITHSHQETSFSLSLVDPHTTALRDSVVPIVAEDTTTELSDGRRSLL
jgi:hypothetical protein